MSPFHSKGIYGHFAPRNRWNEKGRTKCANCLKTASHFSCSVSPMMQRYLLQRSDEEHFVALHKRAPSTQSSLACIGAWMNGYQTASHRFSVASLSLS